MSCIPQGTPTTGYVTIGIESTTVNLNYQNFDVLGFWKNPLTNHQLEVEYSIWGKAIYRAPTFVSKQIFNFEVFLPLTKVKAIKEIQRISQQRAILQLDPSVTLIDAYYEDTPSSSYAVLLLIPQDFGSDLVGTDGTEPWFKCSFTATEI